MGYAQPKYDVEEFVEGVKPVPTKEDSINTALKYYRLIACLKPPFIRRWLNVDGTVSVRVVFKTLVYLRALKVATRARVIEDGQMFDRSVYKAVVWLHINGYVMAVSQTRLIIPFNRHKIDTAYKLTAKGHKVLREIVSAALG